jgi:hypothetical protein
MSLSSFVLVGTILSYDTQLATVEFNMNPALNGGPSLAVMQVSAIPCEVEVGRRVFIVKTEAQEVPTISCEREDDAAN